MTGSVTEFVDVQQLAAELAERLPQPFPLSVQLWTGDMVAQYLHKDPRYVKEKMLVKPDAPKAIRMYGAGHPLYKALDVISWVEKYQEKARAA